MAEEDDDGQEVVEEAERLSTHAEASGDEEETGGNDDEDEEKGPVFNPGRGHQMDMGDASRLVFSSQSSSNHANHTTHVVVAGEHAGYYSKSGSLRVAGCAFYTSTKTRWLQKHKAKLFRSRDVSCSRTPPSALCTRTSFPVWAISIIGASKSQAKT